MNNEDMLNDAYYLARVTKLLKCLAISLTRMLLKYEQESESK